MVACIYVKYFCGSKWRHLESYFSEVEFCFEFGNFQLKCVIYSQGLSFSLSLLIWWRWDTLRDQSLFLISFCLLRGELRKKYMKLSCDLNFLGFLDLKNFPEYTLAYLWGSTVSAVFWTSEPKCNFLFGYWLVNKRF